VSSAPVRLVDQHQRGPVDQGPGDRQPLRFTARQLVRAVADPVLQPDPFERLGGRRRRRGQQADRDILRGREARGKVELLEDEAEPAAAQARQPPVGQRSDVGAVDLDRAARRPVRRANAIRHTPTGGRVTLSCRMVEDRWEIAVAGTGTAPADLPRIFDRSGADASRSRATGGSALGLSIIRRLAEAQEAR
jgi:hypothetical protein